MLVIVLLIITSTAYLNQLDTDTDLRHKIELGKQQLQILLNDDENDPLCWKDSIMTLMNKQCSALNYDSRSNTALKLALCHLKQSGISNINEINCDTTNHKKCMEQIASNEVAFSTYNHFFTSIDNICIYIQMKDHDQNMKKSIHDLYTATIESSDYLMQTQQQQMEFQDEIISTQTEIKQTSDDLLRFHEQHKSNINYLQSMASNIQNQQNNILNKQNTFQQQQNNLFKTMNNMDTKQENILETQQRSMDKQQDIYKMQHEFQSEMNTMYETQTKEIQNANREIQQLTKESQNAYEQIVSMINEVLYVSDAIYRMDLTIFHQFVSIQSATFYVCWFVATYIVTIPKCARSLRIWLFIGILITISLEKCITSIIPIYGYNDTYQWCVFVRQFMFTFNTALFIWFVWSYKDPMQQQKELLQEINHNTKHIQIPRIRTKRITFSSAFKSITPKNIWNRFTK